MTTPRVVVMAFGEVVAAETDPASLVLAKLRESAIAEDGGLTLIDDDQLRMEHALDLQPNDLAVFIDRRISGKPPFEFREILAGPDYRILPAAGTLLPSDLLHTLSTIARGGQPPGSFLLALPDYRAPTDHDDADPAEDSVSATMRFLEDLLNNPESEYWQSKTDR